jgi:hypothetical protein
MGKNLDGEARARRGLKRSLELAEAKLRGIRDDLEDGNPDQTLHKAKSLLGDVGDIVACADSWETLRDIRDGILADPQTIPVEVTQKSAGAEVAAAFRRAIDAVSETTEGLVSAAFAASGTGPLFDGEPHEFCAYIGGERQVCLFTAEASPAGYPVILRYEGTVLHCSHLEGLEFGIAQAFESVPVAGKIKRLIEG